jgi:radical SAM protein with 4Fe4S-binding SPASM domain
MPAFFFLIYKSMNTNNLPKSFCVLPWMHSAINPNGDVKACCMSAHEYVLGNLNQTPLLKDIFNGEKAKQLRREMVTNLDKLPDSCRMCTIHEQTRFDSESYRTRSNIKYKDFVEQLEVTETGEAEFRQLYIDYRFSNKCNFKCITCGPSLSSSHALEYRKINWDIPKPGIDDRAIIEVDHKSFFEQFKEFSHEIREIYFAGGEPLINDHHYEILQLLIDTQQPISIYYNTNFSNLNYKDYDLLDMWSKVNGKIDIYASVDGYGKEGEAVRFGLDTATFESNVRTIFESGIPNISLRFSITYGITNYRKVVDTAVWLMSMIPEQYHEQKVGFNPIVDSIEFSLLFLNAEQRKEAVRIVTEQINQLKTHPHPRALDQVTNLEQKYLYWISHLDVSAYPDQGKKAAIRTRWNLMNRTNAIRKTEWKTDLPDLANDWLAIWTELDAKGIDMGENVYFQPLESDGTLSNNYGGHDGGTWTIDMVK